MFFIFKLNHVKVCIYFCFFVFFCLFLHLASGLCPVLNVFIFFSECHLVVFDIEGHRLDPVCVFSGVTVTLRSLSSALITCFGLHLVDTRRLLFKVHRR